MSTRDFGTAQLRPILDEIAWRHVWLTNVMIDSGKPALEKIARPKLSAGRTSLARRLHKLRRMRATLESIR
jgi:hypothetical protein